jgi:hypothetical protein
MSRPVLIGYQLLIGLSDTLTGGLLIVAPEFTLRLMRLHVAADALIFLSFIGAFVQSVGLACLYGAFLTWRHSCASKIEVVWLLTAITRAAVAIFVLQNVLACMLESGWLSVAATDGACVLFQAVGLHKGWLAHAAK